MALLGDLVIIRPSYSGQLSEIILPSWQKSLLGFVEQVGPSCNELKIGDKVQFGAASGMTTTHRGIEVRIMREDDVLCVLE